MEHISESVCDIQTAQILPVSSQNDISYVWYTQSGKYNV